MRRHPRLVLPLMIPLAALAPACGSDDAGGAEGAPAATATAAPAPGPQDPRVEAAVASYTRWVHGQTAQIGARTRALTDAVRAGRLERARALYAPSREPWERIEPIAGLIEATDGAVDARVDDFAGPDDPAFTGWHRLELLLWERGTTDGAAPFATRLDRDLAALRRGIDELEIPADRMAIGAAELIQEASAGKITGEEDRYSKTDLWDLGANVAGARRIATLLAPALADADPGLLRRIEAGFAEVDASLEPLRDGDGWVPYCQPDDPHPAPGVCDAPTVTAEQVEELRVRLAALAEDLALVPGALGPG